MKRTVAVLLAVFLSATGAAAADRLRIGYSSISGAYIGIWVAHDAGYFAREGLDDQVILIPNGSHRLIDGEAKEERHVIGQSTRRQHEL